VAEGKAMSRDVDPRRLTTALIERFGYDDAAAYAVDRIAELNDLGNMYELSIWREIRKAIADLTKKAGRGK
jgi:hypothetical protein